MLLILWVLPTPASAEQPKYCGLYPETVVDDVYVGWSACLLRESGEKPLWRGLTSDRYRQQIRFTLSEGHGRFTIVINFAELIDGRGIIGVWRYDRGRDDTRRLDEESRSRISRANVAKLNRLAAESGNWDFPTGTWDDQSEGTLYLHCDTLDMERVTAEGYRFSAINISCNHPQRLMPLVNHLTRLAGLRPRGSSYY